MSDLSLLTQSYQVRSYETTTQGIASLYSINNYLQETAGYHAQQLRFDISDLLEQNQTWVLQRLVIQMDRFPKWRELINIQTWPSGADGLRAYRDFKLCSSDHQELGRALSYWMIIDLNRRRPVRLPETLLTHRAIREEHLIDVDRNRISFPEDNLTKIDSYPIQPSDIDVNQHVNNAVYTRIIENAICKQFDISQNSISEWDITFLHEAYLSDVLHVWAIHKEEFISVVLKNDEDKEISKAKIRYHT
jgi:acyl-ACP thioesterase